MSDMAQTLIGRKIAQSGASLQADFPEQAVARWLRWIAEEDHNLVLSVGSVRLERGALGDQMDAIGAGDLRIGLARGADIVGAIALGPELRCALVEQATLGHLSARPNTQRPATRSDRALAAPMLSRFLDGLAPLLQDHVPEGWGCDLTLGVSFPSNRQLELALADGRYLTLVAEVQIAETERAGTLVVLLSELGGIAQRAASADPEPWNAQWVRTVNTAEVELDGILGRMSVPMSWITGAQIGDVLPLSGLLLHSVQLETATGQIVARGRLGQMSGHRAIRLEGAPPAMMTDLDGLGDSAIPEGASMLGLDHASDSQTTDLDAPALDAGLDVSLGMDDPVMADSLSAPEPALPGDDTAPGLLDASLPETMSMDSLDDIELPKEGDASPDLDDALDFEMPQIDLDLP